MGHQSLFPSPRFVILKPRIVWVEKVVPSVVREIKDGVSKSTIHILITVRNYKNIIQIVNVKENVTCSQEHHTISKDFVLLALEGADLIVMLLRPCIQGCVLASRGLISDLANQFYLGYRTLLERDSQIGFSCSRFF